MGDQRPPHDTPPPGGQWGADQSGAPPPPPPGGPGQGWSGGGQPGQGWSGGGQPGQEWSGGGQPAQGWPGGPQYGPTGARPPASTNGLAIGALVAGLIALPLAFFLIGGFLGLVALILGIFGLRKARDLAGAGRGMSIAGIVTGALAMLLAVLVIVGIAALFQDPEFQRFFEEEMGRQEELQEQLED